MRQSFHFTRTLQLKRVSIMILRPAYANTTCLARKNSVLSTNGYWKNHFFDGVDQQFTIAYQTMNMIGFGVSIALPDLGSLRARVIGMFAICIVASVALPFLSQSIVAVICCGLFGICDSILSAAIFSWACTFNPKYTNALMSGQVGSSKLARFCQPLLVLFATKHSLYIPSFLTLPGLCLSLCHRVALPHEGVVAC
jgi:hypothetical protein